MLTAGRVSTIIQGYSVFRYPTGLAFTVDDLAYITTDTRGLFQLNLRNKSVTKLTSGAGLAGSLSAAQLGYPHGLTFLSTSVLLITDAGKDHLLIANIRNNTINKICTGTQGTRDGGIRSCQLHDPYSVLIVNQSVFVGQDGAIRRLPIAALGGFIQPVESSMPVPGKDSSVYHPLMAPWLKGLWHGQNWLHLFVDSEADHEQMGPIPSSNGSLDIALSNAQLGALGNVLFRPSTHKNWPRERKFTQSCWCSRWFLGLRANVWKILLHVHTRLVVTHVYIENMFNKNIEIGFQSAVFHICQRAFMPLLQNDRGPNATTSI